jgi:putative colanic acid biosynthesis glycosyltransferase
MKIAQINATCGLGSTGKICVAVSRILSSKGIENIILYTQGYSDFENGIKYSDEKYKKIQALKSRIYGNYGFNSEYATIKLINELKKFSPDIVHLHNIHAHDCNIQKLFEYLKSSHIKVYWTFHDCWAFTGYCTHFTIQKCDKWMDHCFDCPVYRNWSWFCDRSSYTFDKKKRILSSLNLTIVTPSVWLKSLVEKSFFKDKKIVVINNGIDLEVFKPTINESIREKYGIKSKHIILGVASIWNYEKGIDAFVKLSQMLDDEYTIVLVGTDDNIDKELPSELISIHRTYDSKELASIYSCADVFFNPTREENYPTVNMEAIACGTPVVTYNTGGSGEMITPDIGCVIEPEDLESAVAAIKTICENKKIYQEKCIEYAKNYDEKNRYNEYIRLYK